MAALTLDDFAPHVGDTFVADFGDDGTLDLTLAEAEVQSTGNDHDEAFSLVFRGPLDNVFEQATVPILHESVGALDIFLVPVADVDDGRLYQAIFTRTLD